MDRRHLIGGTAALALAGVLPAKAADPAAGGTAFDAQTVRALARNLAATGYKPPDTSLPGPIANIGYDDYRTIRFDANQALWRGDKLYFQAQFFHRGWLYQPKVDIYEVEAGHARPIAYRSGMFTYGPEIKGTLPPDLGFAGFRLHAPINRADYYDEVAVFLGASYFRAVGRNLGYGISSRGLSLNTADPRGEEFPLFRTFWLERPAPGTSSIVVWGLIDSPSTTGAMRLTIRPGDDTTMDVELTLYPRTDLAQAGIATGTSMFLFDGSNRLAIDDWRPAVHDSDGLLMLTGRNEHLWRPLANPRTLQISAFQDAGPRGFGLMQRARKLADYDDLEARYERRPSLWVEPIGDWGEGQVVLVEIPTKQEIHDNIVALWRPKQPLRAGQEHGFLYRLHWCATVPFAPDLARFQPFRTGAIENGRVFVIDTVGGKPAPDVKAEARVTTNAGVIRNVVATPDPEQGGWRISFEFLPGDAQVAELRAVLVQGDAPLSEAWIYRWTA